MEDLRWQIRKDIEEQITRLDDTTRDWIVAHLIVPREVRLAVNPDGTEFRQLWLITDATGDKDSSYKVVYDPTAHCFGLEVTLDTGVEWYMGSYGTFVEAVNSV